MIRSQSPVAEYRSPPRGTSPDETTRDPRPTRTVQRARNVLILGTFDTGGQGIRIRDAFDAHSDWSVRSYAKERRFMAYPTDLPIGRERLEDEYQLADVVHVRNKFDQYDQLAAKFGPKPVVIHFHGTMFRGNPEHHIREMVARNAVGIVSTLDLWLLAPDRLTWLPAPYDVDALAAMA